MNAKHNPNMDNVKSFNVSFISSPVGAVCSLITVSDCGLSLVGVVVSSAGFFV
mgnify:CR=1 FL=1